MSITLKAVLDPRALSDGTHTVYIRITRDRKQNQVATGVRIDPKYFNENGNYEKYNWIRSTASGHAHYNSLIKTLIDRIKSILSQDPEITSEGIISSLKGRESKDFIQFWEDHMIIRNERLSANSKEKYVSQLNNFKKFTNKKAVPFSTLTYDLIIKYEAWILANDKAQSTCSKALGFLRTIIKEAEKSGYIKHEKNPFLYFTIKKYKTNKERLTPDEIKIFETKKAHTARIQACIDLFLMQYYTAGARVSDVIQMRWDAIKEDRWHYTMGKTDRMKNIRLNPRALEILKVYGADKSGGYVFPFLTDAIVKKAGDKFNKKLQSVTSQINQALKEFSEKHKINKKVSSHIARHSFADNIRKASGDIYAISKALGHTKISTTETYLSSLDDGAVDKLMDVLDSI